MSMAVQVMEEPGRRAMMDAQPAPAPMPMPMPRAAGPSADPPFPGTSNGRLRDLSLTGHDRGWAVAIHLSTFAMFVVSPLALVAPLIIWAIRREQSAFVDDHGREFFNFTISQIILTVGLAVSLVGIIAIPFVWLVGVISMVRAAVAAGHGEYFRYPMTWRFFS